MTELMSADEYQDAANVANALAVKLQQGKMGAALATLDNDTRVMALTVEHPDGLGYIPLAIVITPDLFGRLEPVSDVSIVPDTPEDAA